MSPVLTRVSSGQGFSSVATYKRSFIARSAGGAYQIARSLRFNSPDSAYLSRTPASAGNQKLWTLSFWYKAVLQDASTRRHIFTARDGSGNHAVLNFRGTDDKLEMYYYAGGLQFQVLTTAVFRDPSAWYHVVVIYDTDQATASNRIKFYVNGTQITAFGITNYPTQGYSSALWNSTNAHAIGREDTSYLSGYLADIHFIDGQALTPSSFGETSATTGQWIPKTFSGSYGTNGFKLNFSDNSDTTATTLGKDSSGNGLNWTPNNFSVTAGSGNDSFVDTPTSYGTDTGVGAEVRGNYCTWNPLCRSSSYATISNGNLNLAVTTNDYGYSGTLFVPNSGKWYFEITLSATVSNGPAIGIVSAQAEATDMYDSSYASGLEYGGPVYAYNPGQGTKMSQSASTSYVTAANPSVNDVFMVAVDFDNGAIYFGKNGTWLNSGVPTSGATKTGAAFTSIDAGSYAPVIHAWGTGITGVLNAGQRAFAYTAPSGFKALCDTNLSAPTIALPSNYVGISTWTGNGSTQTISGLGFSPDLVVFKSRTRTLENVPWTDSVRGATKAIYSNLTNQEGTDVSGLTAFTSDGFTMGSDGAYNATSGGYVAWAWDAASSNATNNDGSIQSTIRANTTSGFSIVSWTSTSSSATIGHGLGAEPHFIITKGRGGDDQWVTYHKSVGATKYLYLNSGAVAATYSGFWNNTAPTNTVFTTGTDAIFTTNGRTKIAYCFAPVPGYSAFGSYVGNASAGRFVYTGFRPKIIMVKAAVTGGYSDYQGWYIWDSVRGTYNYNQVNLTLNTSQTEGLQSNGNAIGDIGVDILSNGFTLRGNDDAATNWSSETYIYCAWADSPFQYSRAR